MTREDPARLVGETRWGVFATTTRELFRSLGPRVFFVALPIFVAFGIYRQGLAFQAGVDAILFTLIIVLANFLLCVGFAAYVAIIYRKDGGYKRR